MLVELKKIIKHREFYLAFFCLLLIMFVSVIQSIQEYYADHELFLRLYKHYPDALYLLSPHVAWLGMTSGTSSGFFHLLFYFIFPLLISIPIVDAIYKERSSENLNYIWVRKKRGTYYRNKFVFAFFFSFFLFLIPALLSVLLANLITGQWDYSSYVETYTRLIHGHALLPDSTFSNQKPTLFSSIYGTSLYLYIFIYYIIDALYAGAYICLGLALSLFVKNKYLIYFIPQMAYVGGWIFLSILGSTGWDPFYFLMPAQAIGGLAYLPLIIDFFILIISAIIIYVIGVKRKVDLLP